MIFPNSSEINHAVPQGSVAAALRHSTTIPPQVPAAAVAPLKTPQTSHCWWNALWDSQEELSTDPVPNESTRTHSFFSEGFLLKECRNPPGACGTHAMFPIPAAQEHWEHWEQKQSLCHAAMPRFRLSALTCGCEPAANRLLAQGSHRLLLLRPV